MPVFAWIAQIVLVLVNYMQEEKMVSIPIRDRIGTCPACNSPLIKATDNENRVWARCTSCGAQIPIEMFAKLKSGK